MTDTATIEFGDPTPDDAGRVPPPLPPDHPAAWYAPDVRAQYELHPGVVATVTEADRGFAYAVREPSLGPADEAALGRVRDHFSAASRRRPLTREGCRERAAAGFEPKYRRALDRLLDVTPAARRRIDYRALCELRLLGGVTPLALDDRIEVADLAADDRVVVHTVDYAPARTEFDADAAFVERIAGERLTRYGVGFYEFEVEVVVYRDRLLGKGGRASTVPTGGTGGSARVARSAAWWFRSARARRACSKSRSTRA